MSTVILRAPEAKDYGWVIWRHDEIYRQDYGYNDHFIALVARTVADYMENHDPVRERCWIAEVDGERAGSVFLVREQDDVARLRLLLVERNMRGHGVGRRLVEQCVTTARELGYRRIVLWTSKELEPAIRIYRQFGFRLVAERPSTEYGASFIGQDWALDVE